MKIIDGHAHVGYTGGWANVGITGEELIAQMDRFDIEKTVLCNEDQRCHTGSDEEIPEGSSARSM